MQDRIETGEYVRPCDGETLSGDAVVVHADDDGVFVAVIDALGHGPDAHELAMQLSGILSKWLSCVSVLRTPMEALACCMSRRAARAAPSPRWLGSTAARSRERGGHWQRRCRLFGSVARTVEFREGVLGSRMRPHDFDLFRSAASRCAALVFRRRDRPLRCQ